MHINPERMSDAMMKYHIVGLSDDFNAAVHVFSDVDHGDAHDHPWAFRSEVIKGSYIERIWEPRADGSFGVRNKHRRTGDVFTVPAKRIHRIFSLPDGECRTLVFFPKHHERVSRFWQFRDDGAWSRPHNSDEWIKYVPGAS